MVLDKHFQSEINFNSLSNVRNSTASKTSLHLHRIELDGYLYGKNEVQHHKSYSKYRSICFPWHIN